MSDSSFPGNDASRITHLLRGWQQGDSVAESDLVAVIYAELKQVAANRLRHERGDHTLQPTALVNEAWMRLAQVQSDWQNRAQFFAMAATAMRRILVEHARRRDAAKRGDGLHKVALDDALERVPGPMPDDRLLALDQALTRLEKLDPRQARVVELRFFSGLSVEETSALLDVSPGTVKREWAAARAWLYDAMH